MGHYNYDYKHKNKNDGIKLITIRDIGENALLEVERNDDEIKLVINWQNQKTVGFILPKEIFENLYKDISNKK